MYCLVLLDGNIKVIIHKMFIGGDIQELIQMWIYIVHVKIKCILMGFTSFSRESCCRMICANEMVI